MTHRNTKTVLFLGVIDDSRSRAAETVFNSVAGKMGLPWRAVSRDVAQGRIGDDTGPTAVSAIKAPEAPDSRDGHDRIPSRALMMANDIVSSDRVVALMQPDRCPLLREKFPTWTGEIEFWPVDDSVEAPAFIEREVMGLVARLIGGGKRPEPRPTELPAVERPVEKVPAKKALTVKVGRETAGRRGKGVTTVFDVSLGEAGLKELATILKQRCGTGGTVKDGRIEIQGDQRERLIAVLEEMGYRVKRAGG
jgi:predicted translation initiation factor SUI1